LRLRKLPRFIEAWLTLAWVDLQVSFTRYHYWQHYLTLGVKPHNTELASQKVYDETVSWQRIRELIALSETATRYHWRSMNCLRRCFAQQRILLRRNIASRLHIGVTKDQGQLKAHAWLSVRGSVINDSMDVISQYTELQPESYEQFSKVLK